MKKTQSQDVYSESYIVEKIVGDKEKDGVKYYQVKWQGYDNPKDLTWEPIEHLTNCRESIEAYEKSKRQKAAVKPIVTGFFECQNYPYALIKIDQKDPFLPQYTANPFAFRKYKVRQDPDQKNFVKIDGFHKAQNGEVFFTCETYQKPSVDINFDVVSMLLPSSLTSWARNNIRINPPSNTSEEKGTSLDL